MGEKKARWKKVGSVVFLNMDVVAVLSIFPVLPVERLHDNKWSYKASLIQARD